MKKTCVDCKARFEAVLEDLDEGDSLNCPECNLEYTVVANKKGQLKIIETKQLEMEDDSEEEAETEVTEDYDSE